MIRLVVVSVDPGRLAYMSKIYPAYEVFDGTAGCGPDYRLRCIPETYRRLEEQAVARGYGRETILLQDDVLIPQAGGLEAYNARFKAELLIYGQTEPSGLVVPKAFSASPAVHRKLAAVWTGEGRIGPAWMPLVAEFGLVLDVCRDLGR